MRHPILHCLRWNKVRPLPRFNRGRCEERVIDITNSIEHTNKWISPEKFSILNKCHKPKQSSFVSKNKYDTVLNCNNEQTDVDLRKNVKSVQEEQKQECSAVSDITRTIIKNRNNPNI